MSKHINIKKLGKYIYPAFKDKIIKKFSDVNTTMEMVLLYEVLQYLRVRKINLILIAGPDEKKINLPDDVPYLSKKVDLSDVMLDREYMEKFFHGDNVLLDYAYDDDAGLLHGNRITTNGIHLMSACFCSKWVNVNSMGERMGIEATDGKYHNDIYVYGSCLTFGLFADDRRTFPSYLQTLLNNSEFAGLRVHNFGLKGRNSVLNDFAFVLNTPLKQGDTVVLVEKYSEEIRMELKRCDIKLHDFSDYLNTVAIEKCSFLNSAFHCNDSIYKSLADYSFGLILEKYRCNKGCVSSLPLRSCSYFSQNNKIQQIDSDGLIDEMFIHELKERLHKEKIECDKDAVVGSLVIAANPFTLGHAQLVDLVAKECDFFYVFVIEDKHFEIPFKTRFEMVSGYVTKYSNCKCIATGSYFGADFLFPEYHDRDKYEKKKINNPVIDTMIFVKHIAPILGINRRYLGTEETDPVTRQFNDYLMSILPQFGIDVRVVPRFSDILNGHKISGSYVRELIRNQPSSKSLLYLLPPSSLNALRLFQ